MFRLNPSKRDPFDEIHINGVLRQSGIYVVYDTAGPIYVGRSRINIHRRLQAHLNGRGNRNLALARKLGAGSSLSFTYCRLPASEQGNAESILIAALGVAKFGNLRREGLYENDVGA